MSYAERLKTAIDQAGITAESLAKDLGITRGAVYQLLDGTSKSQSAENCIKTARLLGIEPLWLATGDGPKEISPRTAEAQAIARFVDALPDLAARRTAVSRFVVEVLQPSPSLAQQPEAIEQLQSRPETRT
jgi:transcriptional regulator with XRE-family HTH domain